jgi:hypothetical protein
VNRGIILKFYVPKQVVDVRNERTRLRGVKCQAVLIKYYSSAMIGKLWSRLLGDKLSAYVNTYSSQLLSTVRIAIKLGWPDYCSRMATEHLRWTN